MTAHVKERAQTMRTCPACNAEFPSNTPRRDGVCCPECRERRDRERIRLYQAEHAEQRHEARKQNRETQAGDGRSRAYTVEFDPDRRGGFPAGNTLDRCSVDIMLSLGNFNVGTILSRAGQRWKVTGWGPQRLEKVIQ